MLFGGNAQAANFAVMDTLTRSGDVASLTNYRIYADPIPSPNGPIQQDITELDIDCSARTVTTRAVHAFQHSGRWVASFGPEPIEPIQRNQTWDLLAGVACDGVRYPESQIARGPNAARELGLTKLR